MDKYEAIRQWLHANMPSPCSEGAYYDPVETLRQKLQLSKDQIRMKLQWKDDLASKLGLDTDNVIHTVNTIVREMEQALIRGDRVLIDGFGILTISDRDSERNTVRFQPDKAWVAMLNPPIDQNKLGLKYKLNKRKITKRVT